MRDEIAEDVVAARQREFDADRPTGGAGDRDADGSARRRLRQEPFEPGVLHRRRHPAAPVESLAFEGERPSHDGVRLGAAAKTRECDLAAVLAAFLQPARETAAAGPQLRGVARLVGRPGRRAREIEVGRALHQRSDKLRLAQKRRDGGVGADLAQFDGVDAKTADCHPAGHQVVERVRARRDQRVAVLRGRSAHPAEARDAEPPRLDERPDHRQPAAAPAEDQTQRASRTQIDVRPGRQPRMGLERLPGPAGALEEIVPGRGQSIEAGPGRHDLDAQRLLARRTVRRRLRSGVVRIETERGARRHRRRAFSFSPGERRPSVCGVRARRSAWLRRWGSGADRPGPAAGVAPRRARRFRRAGG